MSFEYFPHIHRPDSCLRFATKDILVSCPYFAAYILNYLAQKYLVGAQFVELRFGAVVLVCEVILMTRYIVVRIALNDV